jgi:triosephosphate isomerase
MRKPLIAANWKMNKSIGEAVSFASVFAERLYRRFPDKNIPVDVLVCPSFLSIPALCALFANEPVDVGAQNMYWEEKGAFTGEVSPHMLKDAGCLYVIVGHSERRHIFGESDDDVLKKVRAALNHGLRPIVCVGETLEEREDGKTADVVSRMVRAAFSQVKPEEISFCTVAYEPVWAIGTGREARPDDAQDVILGVRETVDAIYKQDLSEHLRVLYGGSVKSSNVRSFMSRECIDGVLVGGASLDPEEFFKIVEEGYKAKRQFL